MGCDIHVVLERKEPDSEWVGVWCSDRIPWEGNSRLRIAQRDYGFFGQVASVRDHEQPGRLLPKGWPKQPSRLAWLMFHRAPTDYHSVSHLSTDDFLAAWRRANPNDPKFREQFAYYDMLGIDREDGGEYRVVFWFDN